MEKRRIKKGNDFIYLWSIVRNGLPENLADSENRKLYLHTANGAQELTDYSIVGGNIVRIEFTPEVTAALGDYRLELSYTVADDTLADKGRKCAVDTYAFTIVSHSEDVDVNTELAATSEIAIGLIGRKGDPFRFEDFTPEQLEALKVKGEPFAFEDLTPEQIAVLQLPALEAIEELPQLITDEVTRVISETPSKTNPGVIDLKPGEYLMDAIMAINARPEEEKPTAENPITINFYNHSKTIDWSRWNGLIHVPRFVHINFVGDIDWWPYDYYLGKVFEEGLLSNNPTDKLFLGFSFSRENENGTIFVSGLPLNLRKICFGGLGSSVQETSSYQYLIDNLGDWGEFDFNLVRVNGNKGDDAKNDALYKKVNGLFVDITPDFRNCEMMGVLAIGSYFYSANLQGANLAYANLAYANLRYANLGNANLGNANLGNANLGNANLESANLWNAHLGNANLQNASLQYANLAYANLGNANLGNANLENAYLWNANLAYAYLESANLENAYLWNANLENAYLWNANLQRANLQGANRGNAYLENANLTYAYLGSANLAYANLAYAYLGNIQVDAFSNFQGANLTGAYGLPETLNTKAKFIAAVRANNVNAETIWIDGTSILS